MKPENILFTDNSCTNVKIIDFGASCESCKQGFTYVQSRYYRAPEVVLGCQYDFAVDIWSLGCIIYELIVGSPLFPAKDENELLEFFFVTCGRIPDHMLFSSKKYKQFYRKEVSPNEVKHELVRSQKSTLGSSLVERSYPIKDLLKNKASPDLIDFLEKCLSLDPITRLKPEDALWHPLFKIIE